VSAVDPREPHAYFDAYACPDCDYGLVSVADDPYLLHCRTCDKYFEVPGEHRAEETDDRAAADAREDELSGLRIRQLAAARRASYRARSHCVVGALVCVVAVVQLTWNGVRAIRTTGFGLRAIAYLLVAVVAAWGATYFFRKAMELDREAKRTELPPAAGEPDFTPLSDGSQQWKNLDEVR
jgi:hypothetical protein